MLRGEVTTCRRRQGMVATASVQFYKPETDETLTLGRRRNSDGPDSAKRFTV